MKYKEFDQKQIVEGYTGKIDIEQYCKDVGISKSSFYKWARKYGNDFIKWKNNTPISDVTEMIKAPTTINQMTIKVNDIEIIIDENYDDRLLGRLILSLRKI